MLKYFQAAYISRYIVILFVAILLWAPSLILPTSLDLINPSVSESTWWSFVLNEYFLTIVAFVIVLLSGLFVNQVATENGLTGRISVLPLFLFILLASSLLGFTNANQFVLVNLLLILIFRLLFSIPNTDNQIPVIFNASFLLGISSLFYSQLLILLLLIWVSLIIHRSNNWRNYSASIIGLALPYLFLFTWYFWNDQTNLFTAIWSDLFTISPVWNMAYGIMDIIISFVLLILVFFSFINAVSSLTEKSINLRRNLIIVSYSTVLIFIIILFFHSYTSTGLLMAVPSALLMANHFNHLRKHKLINIILGFLLFAIFINQYLRLISLVL